MAAQVRVAVQVRMAAQVRMGVRSCGGEVWIAAQVWVRRRPGIGWRRCGSGGGGGAWLACLGELWVAPGGSAGELVSRRRKRTRSTSEQPLQTEKQSYMVPLQRTQALSSASSPQFSIRCSVLKKQFSRSTFCGGEREERTHRKREKSTPTASSWPSSTTTLCSARRHARTPRCSGYRASPRRSAT